MYISPQALSRAISWPGVATRPASVLGLALLQGMDLVDKLVFDPSTNVFFDDPAIGMKLYGALHGAKDLMADSYGGGEHCIGMQFGAWWLIAAKLDEYTLVAMCPAGAYPWSVENWLPGLLQALRACA
jgi:hypothetical protein